MTKHALIRDAMRTRSGRDAAATSRARTDDLDALPLQGLKVAEGNHRALELHAARGFVVLGRLPHAIRVDGRHFTKLPMALQLR